MINVYNLLFEICEDASVYDPECELIESGILDSYSFIELFSSLEDLGIKIYPTQIDRSCLKTPKGIEMMVQKYMLDHNAH